MDPVIFQMEANLDLHMTQLAQASPVAQVVREPNLVAVWIPVPSAAFNHVFSYDLTDDAGGAIDRMVAFFAECKTPFSWTVGPSTRPDDFEQRLQGRGFAYHKRLTGMACRRREMEPLSCPPLTIRRVMDRRGFRLFDWLHTESGGDPTLFDRYSATIPETAYTGSSCIHYYLGFKENQPVAGGILIVADSVAGIYSVTTLPKERRQGYATALMFHLMEVAWEQGAEVAVLEASDMGTSLYRQMGFYPVCEYRNYTLSF